MKQNRLFAVPLLSICLLLVSGAGIAAGQEHVHDHQMRSMGTMMNHMDSLMTQMHAMMGDGGHAMMHESMHGRMGSRSAVDSLGQDLGMLGSMMQKTMSRMHHMMSNQEYMDAPGQREALEQMQRHMQGMMEAYQGMTHQMRDLMMDHNGNDDAQMK